MKIRFSASGFDIKLSAPPARYSGPTGAVASKEPIGARAFLNLKPRKSAVECLPSGSAGAREGGDSPASVILQHAAARLRLRRSVAPSSEGATPAAARSQPLVPRRAARSADSSATSHTRPAAVAGAPGSHDWLRGNSSSDTTSSGAPSGSSLDDRDGLTLLGRSALPGAVQEHASQADARRYKIPEALFHPESLQDLVACVHLRGGDMSGTHASHAMVTLAKSCAPLLAGGARRALPPEAAQLMHHLTWMLLQPQHAKQPARVEYMSGRNLSRALWAIVVGHCESGLGFQSLLRRLADRRVLDGSSGTDLSRCAWAMATSAAAGRSGALSRRQSKLLFSRIAAVWRQRAPPCCCGPQSMANLLWAFATVGCLGPGLAQALCRQVATMRLDAFSPRQLSRILWACKQTALLDAPLVEAVGQEATRRNLRGWNVQAMGAQTAEALVTLATLLVCSPTDSRAAQQWRAMAALERLLAQRQEAAWALLLPDVLDDPDADAEQEED